MCRLSANVRGKRVRSLSTRMRRLVTGDFCTVKRPICATSLPFGCFEGARESTLPSSLASPPVCRLSKTLARSMHALSLDARGALSRCSLAALCFGCSLDALSMLSMLSRCSRCSRCSRWSMLSMVDALDGRCSLSRCSLSRCSLARARSHSAFVRACVTH